MAATFFPVVAQRYPRLKIPVYVYLFARYFGTGVIVATAFIHLLDPAYAEIGPSTCVGMTGNWSVYSWPPAIVLTSVMVIFLMDFGAELYVESKYGVIRSDERAVVVQVHDDPIRSTTSKEGVPSAVNKQWGDSDTDSLEAERSFRQQIAAFLILEFGVIFHSVIIGLNLGVAGASFSTLYPVLVFHQSFEGLGIGARMWAIPFKNNSWLPWGLCILYGLTTPIAISVGLGVRYTYNSASNNANIIAGVFDSISAGILIYTGLVELLARDFLFDPSRTNDRRRLGFMIACTLLGTGVMALLGKWA
jgi:zinc transporter 1/2/3